MDRFPCFYRRRTHLTHRRGACLGLLALFTIASLFAEAPIAETGIRDGLTQNDSQPVAKFVTERLAVWQKRLSLQDWHVSIVMTRRDDLRSKTLGGIRWDKSKKQAALSVLDASDYRLPYKEMLADMEFTIVHELVHLELASLPKSEASRSTEEHAVNQIADALLALDRSADREGSRK